MAKSTKRLRWRDCGIGDSGIKVAQGYCVWLDIDGWNAGIGADFLARGVTEREAKAACLDHYREALIEVKHG